MRAGREIGRVELAARLRQEKNVLMAVHENPDGDALGSMVALGLVFDMLGCSWRGFVPGSGELPREYRFLPALERIERGELPQVGEATLYVLDCASPGRFGPTVLANYTCVNIDHHPDNPGFGDLNLVDPAASATAQILYEVLCAGRIPVTPAIGTALYVGVVTDTGRFQYSNTTPGAHRMAARLQDRGVNIHDVYRRVYESAPLGKMMLTVRALSNLRLLAGGQLAVAVLRKEDFDETAVEESSTEGIIDDIRRIAGIKVAALFRERRTEEGSSYRVSLRSTDGSIDVSEVAHVWGGGGHVRAAGYTIAADADEAIAALEREIKARL